MIEISQPRRLWRFSECDRPDPVTGTGHTDGMTTSPRSVSFVKEPVGSPGNRYDDGWDTDLPRPTGTAQRHYVPDRLDCMAQGPVLAAYLSSVDVSLLSGYDRVKVLRAHQRMVAHYQAKLYEDMASVRDANRDMDNDHEHAGMLAASEVRSALHLTRRSTDIDMSFALDLAQRLPSVLSMLSDGVIDYRRARTVERGTCHLTAAVAQGVVERIKESALLMTTGQLAARIRKLCIEANPQEAEIRYRSAAADRKLIAAPTVDGTANLLGLNLPPDRVVAVSHRINAIAKSLRGTGETRTMDQLRADVYLDILSGTVHKSSARAVVHLAVDLDTVAGLSSHPGELNGFSPVISDIAQQFALDHSDAEWQYTITDAETGEQLHSGVTRRRPTATDRRQIESRDRSCSFPGCRAPSADCDIDHITPYSEGGATCPCNNATACRHDHRLKDYGWRYERLRSGIYEWISPFGHTYTTWEPPP
jgi:hypothetical protein